MSSASVVSVISDVLDKYADQLIDLRRDLHTHPELSWAEQRTTDLVVEALGIASFSLQRLGGVGGLVADVGGGREIIALRADLDALPVEDLTDDPWRSVVPGVAHACGHDVHTVALVGAGLALAELDARGLLPGRVRLIFQPAEEVMPGGALRAIEEGALDGVSQIFGIHCDPSLEVGSVGLREGPLTSATDALSVRLVGLGGHTSRPHLTADLTYALGKLVCELPAILSRRMDPRAGVSVVWGMVRAGAAHNVIPHSGQAAGTVRMLDPVAWVEVEQVIRTLIHEIVQPYGVTAEVDYQRGVPPVVNSDVSTSVLARASKLIVGSARLVSTQQSLGGEDFGWYVEQVPGAMARLGTRTPGGPGYDLHQGNLRVDEQATLIGARLLAGAALVALGGAGEF